MMIINNIIEAVVCIVRIKKRMMIETEMEQDSIQISINTHMDIITTIIITIIIINQMKEDIIARSNNRDKHTFHLHYVIKTVELNQNNQKERYWILISRRMIRRK